MKVGVLRRHQFVHSDEKSVACSFCDFRAKSSQCLHQHIRSHLEERPHPCSLCTSAFRTRSALLGHVKSHTREKPYKCLANGCSFSSQTKSYLTTHEQAAHSDVRSFICTVCSKSFRTSSTLNCHKLTHSEDKPHSCSLCPYVSI